MYKAHPRVLFQKLGEEGILLHLDSEEYYELNEVGTRIWELIIEQKDTDGLISGILDEYQTTREDVAEDVQQLLLELSTLNLVVNE